MISAVLLPTFNYGRDILRREDLMNNKPTAVSNMFMDGEDIASVRPNLTTDTWESGIRLQIANLVANPPFETSRAVVASLANSGHQTLLMPAPFRDAYTEPVQGIEWSKRRSDYADATPKGLQPLYCADGPVENRDQTGRPKPGPVGTGLGADAVIYITPQDYIATSNLPGGRPDEVLLHEMVHALRIEKGLNLCLGIGENYDSIEEFHAILITNIYRSENGKKTLRAHHNGKTLLPEPLTDDGRFYQHWKAYVDLLVSQMRPLCTGLARVRCAFNPMRRALQA
jgi:hypothetical protein